MKTQNTNDSSEASVAVTGSGHPELETTRDTLERIFKGKTLKWELMGMIVVNPILKIYYPSEQAFKNTCSRRPGGPSLTEEGEEMRKEARQMRAAFLAEFPDGMVGFAIEQNDRAERPKSAPANGSPNTETL